MKYINDFTRTEHEIPDGAEIHERPSVYAVITKGDSILMVKPDHNLWAPPGGGMEPNETVEEAVKREVLEETGCTVTNLDLFDSAERYFFHEKDDKFYHVEASIFKADIDEKKIENPTSVTDGEIKEIEWIKLKNLNKENCHFLFLPTISKLQE